MTSGKDNTPIKIDLNKVSNIEEFVGYWRKANQIHKWFVDNVQEGVDNCSEYYVSKEQLKQLLNVCKKVKEDNTLAEELLPTSSGFFFGNTEYNEWYFKDIEYTIQLLEPLLKEDGDYYYTSSW